VNEEVPWRVDTTPDFEGEFGKLDPTIQRRLAAYLLDVTQLPSPRQRGNAATRQRINRQPARILAVSGR